MSNSENSGDPLRTQLLQRLQSLQRAGVTSIPHPVAPIPSQAADSGQTEATASARSETPSNAPQDAPSGETETAGLVTDPTEALRVLKDEVCQCTLCPELPT